MNVSQTLEILDPGVDNARTLVSINKVDRRALAKHVCGFLNAKDDGRILIGAKRGTKEVFGLIMNRAEKDQFRQSKSLNLFIKL